MLRVSLYIALDPQPFPDTGTYLSLAHQIAGRDLSTYDGRRTPGYPMAILVAGFSPEILRGLQMFAGLVASLCLFQLAFNVTSSPAFGFLAAMTYNLNLAQLFFESSLIPETFTTVFVICAVAVMSSVCKRLKRNQKCTSRLVFTGFLAGVAVMLRPQFIFLPVVLGAYVIWLLRRKVKAERYWALASALLVVAPGLVFVLGWSYFNHVYLGRFTLSTQTGVGLTEHTIAFVEFAPQKYSEVKTVLIRYRDAHLARTGRHTATWDAVPELRQRMGVSQAGVDRELFNMSLALIAAHPFRYAALVWDAWVSFWLVSNPPGLRNLSFVSIGGVLSTVWHAEQLVLRAINLSFLIFVSAVTLFQRYRATIDASSILAVAIIVPSSLLQAILLGVDNTRYGVTVQALIVVVTLIAVHRLYAMTWLFGRNSTSVVTRADA